MDTYTEAVQKLYVAYFSRPADPAGLTYWKQVVSNAQGDISAVAAAFAASQEYRDTYAGKSGVAVIDTIYRNLFGRTPEPAGLEYWGNALDTGAITVDNAVQRISVAAAGDDIISFASKVAASDAFTNALDTPFEADGYAGMKANTVAKEWLAGITTGTALAKAIEPIALAQVISKAAQAGPLVVLPNSLTAEKDTLTGTEGKDRFFGAIDTTADSRWHTLGPSDVIDGGAGEDTLVIAAYTRLDGMMLVGGKNIETLELVGTGTVWMDSADLAGVRLIDGSGSGGVLGITAGTGVTVKGGAADDSLSARGANAVLQGGAGKDVLKVYGVAASAVTLTGGQGEDKFDVSEFRAANAGAAVTITDLAKGERIAFASSASADFVSSRVTLIDEATFDNYASEAARAADAKAASHGIAWFQYRGNTFIVQDIDGNGNFDGGVDIIVKLTGLVDLSTASFNKESAGTLMLV
ncbi:DUF4214 domain-containing protein [Massilia sp. IC2-477]|uniref:DUF4214 domain-containing protein n=1 Tax=Massilia sp. IC2-477 TaxID=2887198 RepID=UPI001D0FBC0E|nr:DUF4214 domain-containing protein [Massilia sp. IC2-477]MCC2958628.1 DUF4214 domain-containing protein [Massilia sp. IC2-477]